MGGHRGSFKYRTALTAHSLPELAEKLEAVASGARPSRSGEGARRILFVFTGQGAQWAGCGDSLMAIPAYAQAVRQVDALFESHSGWSILERVKTLDEDQLKDTIYAQPVTFMIQVGLLHLLRNVNLVPQMVSQLVKTCPPFYYVEALMYSLCNCSHPAEGDGPLRG